MPGGFVCSGSMKGTPRADVREAVAGKRKLRDLFSKEQRVFYADHAPAGVALDDLSVLGPIFVLKLKFARAYDRGSSPRCGSIRTTRHSRALDQVCPLGGVPGRRGDEGLPRRAGRRPRRRAGDEDPESARVLRRAPADDNRPSARRMSSPPVEEPKPGKAKRGGSGRMIAVDEPVATRIPTADGNEEPAVELERRFFNRELSALEYDARVLACASRPGGRRSSVLSSWRSSAAIWTSSSRSAFRACATSWRRRGGHVAGRHEPPGQIDAIRARTGAVATQTRLFEREVKPLLRAGGVRSPTGRI